MKKEKTPYFCNKKSHNTDNFRINIMVSLWWAEVKICTKVQGFLAREFPVFGGAFHFSLVARPTDNTAFL